MSVKPGQFIYQCFSLLNWATNVPDNADSLPIGVVVHNGINTDTTCTITNRGSTGDYLAIFICPDAYYGDEITLKITATVDGLTQFHFFDIGFVDMYVSDLTSSNSDIVPPLVNTQMSVGNIIQIFQCSAYNEILHNSISFVYSSSDVNTEILDDLLATGTTVYLTLIPNIIMTGKTVEKYTGSVGNDGTGTVRVYFELTGEQTGSLFGDDPSYSLYPTNLNLISYTYIVSWSIGDSGCGTIGQGYASVPEGGCCE